MICLLFVIRLGSQTEWTLFFRVQNGPVNTEDMDLKLRKYASVVVFTSFWGNFCLAIWQ